MKHILKIIHFLLLIGLLTTCQESHKIEVALIQQEKHTAPRFEVVEIDGCEYLRFDVTHGYATLCHKGNCKNPIHCYNKISPKD